MHAKQKMAIVLIFQKFFKISNSKINNAGDKGISVGEASQVEVNNLLVKNAHSCVVSKDLSVLKINNISLYECNVSFSLQKSLNLCGAKIIAEKVKSKSSQNLYFTDKESIIHIEGNMVNAENYEICTT